VAHLNDRSLPSYLIININVMNIEVTSLSLLCRKIIRGKYFPSRSEIMQEIIETFNAIIAFDKCELPNINTQSYITTLFERPFEIMAGWVVIISHGLNAVTAMQINECCVWRCFCSGVYTGWQCFH